MDLVDIFYIFHKVTVLQFVTQNFPTYFYIFIKWC